MKPVFLLVAALAVSLCNAQERVDVRGTMESVEYGGQRTNIDLNVGDVLRVDFFNLPQDQIKYVEIAHSRQRLQRGRFLTESRVNDDGRRPVGSVNTSLYFSVTQHGKETLFVRAVRESGVDTNWRQIDLIIQPSATATTATTTARPAR